MGKKLVFTPARERLNTGLSTYVPSNWKYTVILPRWQGNRTDMAIVRVPNLRRATWSRLSPIHAAFSGLRICCRDGELGTGDFAFSYHVTFLHANGRNTLSVLLTEVILQAGAASQMSEEEIVTVTGAIL